jgi:hypothetical protein
MLTVAGREGFAVSSQWDIPCELLEQATLKILETSKQSGANETGCDAHRHPVEQIAAEDTQL